MNITFAIETLGCKVNQYESESLRESLLADGYQMAEEGDVPGLVIVNTCCVTHLAERKSRQMIRKYTRMTPKPRIAVIGCYPQIDRKAIGKIDGIDLVMGACDKGGLIRLLKNADADGTEICIKDVEKPMPYDDLNLHENNEKTRAFIKIQDGCDNFCSYCIIPYTRGRIRSRPLDSIFKEACILAGKGYREVVLIGIQSAFYGKELQEDVELVDVVEAVASIDGIERVRLGSAEPTYFTRKRLERLSCVEKFCPHFHLSLQSGSDSVLKAMNRKYTTAKYAEILEDIREIFSNPAITTDLIVGFPGETDEYFKDTLAFISEMAFKDMHVFRYSKRKGTVAACMGGQVNPVEAKNRSSAAMAIAEKSASVFLESQIGFIDKVLFESCSPDGFWQGHTANFTKVCVESNDLKSGQMESVSLNYVKDDIIMGEIV